MQHSPFSLPLAGWLSHGPDSSRRNGLGAGIAGAFAALVSAAALVMVLADLLGAQQWFNPSYVQTRIGEQRALALEDGSLVLLNTATRLTVAFAPRMRRVNLESGEARFTIARNSDRPFIVATPQARVRAVGTVFNVRTAASGTSIAVLQGHVQVMLPASPAAAAAGARRLSDSGEGLASPLPPVDLTVGERAVVTPSGRIVLGAGPPLERLRAWTDGWLVFRDETLADLIAEFNRYHVRTLRIADPGVAGTRVSGTFAADDLTSLEQFLERYEDVRIRAAPDGSEVLERASPR